MGLVDDTLARGAAHAPSCAFNGEHYMVSRLVECDGAEFQITVRVVMSAAHVNSFPQIRDIPSAKDEKVWSPNGGLQEDASGTSEHIERSGVPLTCHTSKRIANRSIL